MTDCWYWGNEWCCGEGLTIDNVGLKDDVGNDWPTGSWKKKDHFIKYRNFTKISNFENQDCMMCGGPTDDVGKDWPLMWGRIDSWCGGQKNDLGKDWPLCGGLTNDVGGPTDDVRKDWLFLGKDWMIIWVRTNNWCGRTEQWCVEWLTVNVGRFDD